MFHRVYSITHRLLFLYNTLLEYWRIIRLAQQLSQSFKFAVLNCPYCSTYTAIRNHLPKLSHELLMNTMKTYVQMIKHFNLTSQNDIFFIGAKNSLEKCSLIMIFLNRNQI